MDEGILQPKETYEDALVAELGLHPTMRGIRSVEGKFFYDPRWRILNNLGLREIVPWALEKWPTRYKRLYYIDLHDLHKTNRQFGDAGGDALLGAMAGVLREFYPPFDEKRPTLVTELLDHQYSIDGASVRVLAGRWGGDEFLIVVLADEEQAIVQFDSRLRSLVAGQKATMPDGSDVALSMSFGIAEYQPGKPWEQMMREANLASGREKAERGLGRDSSEGG